MIEYEWMLMGRYYCALKIVALRNVLIESCASFVLRSVPQMAYLLNFFNLFSLQITVSEFKQ